MTELQQLGYKVIHEITDAHLDAICQLAYIYSGTILVSASLDGSICFWDVTTGILRHRMAYRTVPTSLFWNGSFVGSEELLIGYKDGLICCVRIKEVSKLKCRLN